MKNDGKKWSFGSVFMITLTCLVLAGSALVLIRLSSGAKVDLSRLRPGTVVLNDRYEGPKEQTEEQAAESSRPAAVTAAKSGKTKTTETECTITFSGIAAVEGEVRKNSYISDMKIYDISDIMMMLKKQLKADLNVAFLENVLSDEAKKTDTVASRETALMLSSAGFNAAACGFSKAYALEASGILSTRNALNERGILPLGILDENGEQVLIREMNGIRVAIMQYTDTIPAATRKTMIKNGNNGRIPEADADQIAADIGKAREKGAQAVIILINWGKSGKAVDRAQRTLAQQIADAGADLIIGNGSRTVQTMEELTAAGTGQKVPCFWSLGTLLSANRNSAGRLAGMLIHITIRASEDGKAGIHEMTYTPLYTWKFKQDGRYYYRCMACGEVPDGMDSEQQKIMEKAAGIVRDTMQGTGMREAYGE